MNTSVLIDHEPVADGGFLVRALLRIEGEAPADAERVPLNLSLVLDRSGSMAGEPLRAARDAAQTLVRRLRREDIVSVVAYDNDVRVVAPPATGEEQEQLVTHIGTIQAGGATNLSGGWLRGAELVAQNHREGTMNRVILFTDGQANQGITDHGALKDMARRARMRGVSTTTIGFGEHFDEDLLRDMADAGEGGAYYIEKVDQTRGVFEEELAGLMSLAAQNIRLSVHPGADADHVKVVHDYPSQAEGDTLTVEVGDLYAREPRRILLEVLLGPDAGMSGDAQVVELEVAGQVLTAEGGVELQTIRLPVTLSPTEGGKVEPEVRKEALLLEAAQARDEALEAEKRGDYDGGKEALRRAIMRLSKSAGEDEALDEELEDLKLMEDRFELGDVTVSDVKYMKQRSYLSSRSRRAATWGLSRTRDD